jgi:thiol:disulfide interchange protein DsbD
MGLPSYNRANLFMNARLHARPTGDFEYRLRLLPAFLLVVTMAAFCLRGDAQSSVEARHLKVSLVADQASVSPGSSHTAMPPHVGLLFDLEPGWHIYWTNAGDSGEPPAVKWTLPEEVTVGPLQFPAPKRLPLGPLWTLAMRRRCCFRRSCM